MGDGDELERRLADALGRSAGSIAARGDHAYSRIQRLAARRTRRRRILAAGSGLALTVGALAGVVVLRTGERSAVTTAPRGPDAPLPVFEPATLPIGFEVTTAREVPRLPEPEPDEYLQVFRSPDPPGAAVVLRESPATTPLPPFGSLTEDQTAIHVGGAPGVLTTMGPDRSSLRWTGGGTSRELHGTGLTSEELLVMARSAEPRVDGPGYETPILPAGLAPVAEGAVDVDEVALRQLVYRSGDDASLDVTIRAGSPLELDYLRLARPEAQTIRRSEGAALLVPGEEGSSDTLYWTEGDGVVIEVRGEGVERGELVRFADDLRRVDQDAWEELKNAAGDRAVVVRGDETPPAPVRPGAEADEPDYVIRGLLNATLEWEASWDEPGPDGRCVTVTLAERAAEACFGDGPGAARVDVLGRTAVVTVDVDPSASGLPVDASHGDVTIAWVGADHVPAGLVSADGAVVAVVDTPDAAPLTTGTGRRAE